MKTKNILLHFNAFDEGKIFFIKDFIHIADTDSIKHVIAELIRKRKVVRLCNGVYWKPKKDNLFGFDYQYPSIEIMAKAIADNLGIKIIPTGQQALNMLSLSTQVQTNAVYLTNGKSKRVVVNNKNKAIIFIHSDDKNLFKIENKTVLAIVLAMKTKGEKDITASDVKILHNYLSTISATTYLKNIKNAPKWIQKRLSC